MSINPTIAKSITNKSTDNISLLDNDFQKKGEDITFDYQISAEKEKDCDKMSQFSLSNFSGNTDQSCSFSNEQGKKTCELANLLFLLSIYILCDECNDNYCLTFQNLSYITVECECKLIKNCLISNFIKEYCSKKPLNYGCQWHNREIFTKYCTDCNINVCSKCLAEKSHFFNYTGLHTKHETHTLINLLDVNNEIEEIKRFIEGLENCSNIKNVLNNLINDYKQTPSYNGYQTLKNFTKSLPLKEPTNDQLKFEQLYIVKSLTKLEKQINFYEANSFYKIQINEEKTNNIMKDLSLFRGKELINLKILTMNNIELIDISSILTCSFSNLERLDFDSNLITNDCINVFKDLDLPKIDYLSLFDNQITSTEIFGIIEKYKTLKSFHIGKNLFDEKIVKNDKTKYKFPPDLEVLGISNNFTKKTNDFIFTNLDLHNLKVLYMYGNYFTSFEKFEQIKFTRLEQYWSRGIKNKGFITDIKEMIHFNSKKNLQKITLKENQINNIEELVNIINLFPNLKIINLEDNGIEQKRILKVLYEIRKKKGFEKFEILYLPNK